MWTTILSFIMKIWNTKLIKYIIIAVAILAIIFGIYKYFKQHYEQKLNDVERNAEARIDNAIITFNKQLASYVATNTAVVNNFKDEAKRKDLEFMILNEKNKALGNKYKTTVSMLDVQIKINEELRSQVHVTELPKPDAQGNTLCQETDTASIGNLHIYRNRIYVCNMPMLHSEAIYEINYDGSITAFTTLNKEGKWKFKNIFIKRPKYFETEVISSDSIFMPVNVKQYINSKFINN